MALEQRNRRSGVLIALLIFSLLILASLLRFLASPAFLSHGQGNYPKGSSEQVFDSITVSTSDLEPWSFNFFRKNSLHSLKIDGSDDTGLKNVTFVETNEKVSDLKRDASTAKQESVAMAWDLPTRVQGIKRTISAEHSYFFDTPRTLARRLLRGIRRQKTKNRATALVLPDKSTVKHDDAAIKHSKMVDLGVLGKYNMWRHDNENEKKLDTTVRVMRDQMIVARVYSKIAESKNMLDLHQELLAQLKDSQQALGNANFDKDLHHSSPETIKTMDKILSKAREKLYDCKLVTHELRVMLQSAEEEVRRVKKQSTFLSQLVAKTIPSEIHCLSMRLTIAYYLLPLEKRAFPNSEKLENSSLYHYALFSDNVLAASAVVNSTIINAKEPEKHVFHLVTDKLNFGAMSMWFLLNPPGKATIHVENIDDFKWLNSSYCPVLRQLESDALKKFYFEAENISTGYSNLKYRNPKYLSMLNHLRFYLPQVYPKLDKILFLDDDIVVQKDLTALWSIDLNGKVNGAVETCGESFHRFDKYLNFSDPIIAKNFDPNACGWAYGMNIFDLKEWKKHNLTEIYHKWQDMNEDRALWKLGTLPPGLLTFYGLTYALEKSWHVLGLGYNPSVIPNEIENASVIHYNGNMKPWLELAMPRYRSYWTKYVEYNHPYLRSCSIV